ncbi:hypothetical protein BGW39_008043 [Mortierella sp. 14UC]|nr:hypothetical protein BGW39_008043 [Mortierella sp. 14UC]
MSLVETSKGKDTKDAPQLVTLTFEDALQDSTLKVPSVLMSAYRNPNGCPIVATWVVQTDGTDFNLVKQWYAAGNEVANRTMTHVGNPGEVGNRNSISANADIPLDKLSGFRAPFLKYSEEMSAILGKESSSQHCSYHGRAPRRFGAGGRYLAARNFLRHYNGNRAPFGIYLTPANVGGATQLYRDLLKHASSLHDVWFVTNQQLLQWMQDPVPATELAAQPYLKCVVA